MSRPAFSVAAPTREQPSGAAATAPSPASPDAVDRPPLLRRIDWWRVAPTLITIALAIVYLIMKPRSPDLAAHIFRSDLFGREGFTIWNGQWYGGHHTPAYSILAPPLGWLLGPQLAGALAAVDRDRLLHRAGARPLRRAGGALGTLWFAVGSATLLATNRIPFALGVAFGVAAMLALQRERRLAAPCSPC